MAVFSAEIANKQLRKTMVSEALLRWDSKNDEIGPCYPDEFIGILENNGRIMDVGYFVMKSALLQLSIWQKKYHKFYVSFNVSYLQLQDPQFIPSIIKTVKMYKIDPSCVIVELTESVLAADTDMLKSSFKQLKDAGIKIALDDFGTGNTSFWTLHNIDIDIIKLDQSFIRGLGKNDTSIDHAIVESIGLMCDRIGYITVAEGVENDNIWNVINQTTRNHYVLSSLHYTRLCLLSSHFPPRNYSYQ